MFETYVTVIGNVVSDPRRRVTSAGGEVISFRVGVTSRRRDRASGEWQAGEALYLTVSCWGRLVTGVGEAVQRGRPVIVHGHIKTREYVGSDGQARSDLEMTATAVGLDLSRCVVGQVISTRDYEARTTGAIDADAVTDGHEAPDSDSHGRAA
ncbi:hypothetical protein GCM10027169_34390 [Gordonia jinhuaensis]|uniref:Single-stranded DNA-binding protein n=1 Tax=Gordonia jinhuaensis TaxID=1517702 RepID=A0A916T4A2_9ACTN|nr:single-stranded DNA-binding protein [Gordonia jinhuaensis]GGB30810.1 hypothetical protein GCM10011489_18740 [Gordonia jinhuaensis]